MGFQQKNLLLMKEYDGREQLLQISTIHTAFWIQVLNLPVEVMMKAMGEIIGQAIG